LDASPVERLAVNVGTTSTVPSPARIALAGGKARRRPMLSRWDGGPVVVSGKADYTAKGSRMFAASQQQVEVAGEYRRVVAQPCRG
jgi:hypothetical protein